MKRWLLRAAVVLSVLAAGGFLVSASGIISIAASGGHWAVTEWFLQFSKQRSTATHSLGVTAPDLADEGLVIKGARHFELGCRPCHGAPGGRQSKIAQAMLPRPPLLGHRIDDFDTNQLFYIVKHGIKLTGMPAWPTQKRDDEVWAMVAFLRTLPTLDESGYRRLAGETANTAATEPQTPITIRPKTGSVLASCLQCHDTNGQGDGGGVFPSLAGQRKRYLENSLKAYARGTRHSGIMEPIAAALDEKTMTELAAYFAALPAVGGETIPSEVDPAVIEKGRLIAHEGIRNRRVPACVECHGPKSTPTKDTYPSLAGRSARYLGLQLKLFKDGHRGGTPYAHLMDDVAPHLEPAEMDAVARYFESLEGLGDRDGSDDRNGD